MDAPSVAVLLREIAQYLSLEKERYKSRAYEKAASAVENVQGIERLLREKRLKEIPGVGDSLARTIEALVTTGTAPVLENLRARFPGRAPSAASGPRATLLLHAREHARAAAEYLRGCPAARRVEVAGGVRRWLETVEKIVLVVETEDPAAVRAHFEKYLYAGPPVELHTAPAAGFGALLAYATGPDEHTQALAARPGLAEAAVATDEPGFYAALGLPWIPPEARDAQPPAAAPRLLERGDVRGAVHCHTVWSDGSGSVEDMARAAEKLGLEYITITDHSGTAGYAGGLDLERLRRQWDEIDAVQAKVPGVRLLKGTESDILADGALDWPDEILARLDVVIASVHQRYKLDLDKATERLVRCMKLPIFKIWGHPLGRMLLSRDPIACDVDAVLDAAAASPVAIELNGDPHRLDLAPEHARAARARGIPFVVSTDAHSTTQLEYLEYAVHMARRAGLGPGDVLNTLPVAEFARRVQPVKS